MFFPNFKGLALLTTSEVALASGAGGAAKQKMSLDLPQDMGLEEFISGIKSFRPAQWTHFGAPNPNDPKGRFNERDENAVGFSLPLGERNFIDVISFTNSVNTSSSAVLFRNQMAQGTSLDGAMRWGIGAFAGPVTGYPGVPIAPYAGINFGLTDRAGNGLQFSFMPGGLIGMPNVGVISTASGDNNPILGLLQRPTEKLLGAWTGVVSPFLSSVLGDFIGKKGLRAEGGVAADGRLRLEHLVENMRRAQDLTAGRNAGRTIGGGAMAAVGATGLVGAIAVTAMGIIGERNTPNWLKRIFTKPGSTPPEFTQNGHSVRLADLVSDKFQNFNWVNANCEAIFAYADKPMDIVTKENVLFKKLWDSEKTAKNPDAEPLHQVLALMSQGKLEVNTRPGMKPEFFIPPPNGGLSKAASAAKQALLETAGLPGEEGKKAAERAWQAHLDLWRGPSKGYVNEVREELKEIQGREARRPHNDWQQMKPNMTVTLLTNLKSDVKTQTFLTREINGTLYYLGRGDSLYTAGQFEELANKLSDSGDLRDVVIKSPLQEFLDVRGDADIATTASMKGKVSAVTQPVPSEPVELLKVSNIIQESGNAYPKVAAHNNRAFTI